MRLALLLLSVVPLAFPQSRDPLPVPDIPGYKTLKCDFHMHSVFSDGVVWPSTRVAEAWRDGLDVISLTDHAGYNPHKGDVSTDLARANSIIREAGERVGVLVVPGVEVMEGDIHCNALFVKDPNVLFGLDLLSALRKLKEQDAFVFWNHPGWKRKAEWFPLIAAAYDATLFQGMELVNGPDFYAAAYPWVEPRKLTIFGNSDVHQPITAQYEPRKRPVTLVFASTGDLRGVRDALAARRTAVWMNGEVWGAQDHLAALWDGAVKPLASEVVFRKGVRRVGLPLRNHSALPFQWKVRKAPAWLTVTSPELKPESIAPGALGIAKDAPTGTTSLEVEIEVTNFHTGPGSNLVVKMPLTVTVE